MKRYTFKRLFQEETGFFFCKCSLYNIYNEVDCGKVEFGNCLKLCQDYKTYKVASRERERRSNEGRGAKAFC